MTGITISPFDLAQRFVGIKEVSGPVANPQILAMLRLDEEGPTDDAVPWCSAFVNYIAWLLSLRRSKSLRARSWLRVGRPIALSLAEVGFDVVILNRGGSTSPDVLESPGHVGFFAGREGGFVLMLGGNQGDSVSVARFKVEDVLGVRRLLA